VSAEAQLLARLRTGDAAALEALMSDYGSRVYRLAYGITRNQGDAEEVVQDVFLTIAMKSDTFEDRSALGSWIYRITTNRALNKRRDERREVRTSLEDHLPSFNPDGHREGERSFLLADWSQNPEHELLSSETRRVLERAIDTLPEHYRAVLVLRDVEELANAPIAALLGESIASVKSRLHRARMTLRELLAGSLAPHRSPESSRTHSSAATVGSATTRSWAGSIRRSRRWP
jgi:RNA polymerase sigma-70 factor (ECF subfamily)